MTAKVALVVGGVVIGSWFGTRVWPVLQWLWDERQEERRQRG